MYYFIVADIFQIQIKTQSTLLHFVLNDRLILWKPLGYIFAPICPTLIKENFCLMSVCQFHCSIAMVGKYIARKDLQIWIRIDENRSE